MLETALRRLRAGIDLVMHWPALHEDDRVGAVLAGEWRRQTQHKVGFCAARGQFEAGCRKVMTFVDDQIAVCANQVGCFAIAYKALDESDLKPAARVPTPSHRHTNCCLRYTSGLAGTGENDMIMIALNLRPEAEGGVARRLIAVSVYQAFSQGSVRVITAAAATDPEVEERMLSHESDLARMRDGIRRLRRIGQHPAVARIAGRVEYGSSRRSIDAKLEGDALDDWMLAECSDAQHASGTCRMGDARDRRSVVDPACRVLGASGLRVIDASVMPEVVRANTHLTTVMIAEKMADAIRGEPPRNLR